MTCKEIEMLRWSPLHRGYFRSTPCRAVGLCVILTLPAIFRTWTRQRKLVTDTSSWSNLLTFPNTCWVVEPKRSCKIIYLGSMTTVTQRLKIKAVDLFLLKCANLFVCIAITHAWCTESACGNYLRLREDRGTSVQCQRHESTMLHKQGRAELSLFGFLTPFYRVPIVPWDAWGWGGSHKQREAGPDFGRFMDKKTFISGLSERGVSGPGVWL